jgi:hypothetical protein
MHRSLTGLPTRVVVDTNVLLNATFVADSSASYAIAHLSSLGLSPVVTESMVAEAAKVLGRLRIQLALPYDPFAIFRDYLASAKVIFLPAPELRHMKGINRADQIVVAAASEYAAWVLTGDVKFAGQCHTLGITSRFPWDVIMESAIRASVDPPKDYVLRVAAISRESGSIFARVIPGSWAASNSTATFTVCDVENVGCLYYDSSSKGWTFSSAMGVSVFMKCPVGATEEWIVCASYKVGRKGKPGSVTLRSALPLGNTEVKDVSTAGQISAKTPGTIAFGQKASGGDCWNGHIRRIVVSSSQLGGKSWKPLVSIPDAAPDPTDSDVLEAALQRISFRMGRFIFPTELSFRDFWT